MQWNNHNQESNADSWTLLMSEKRRGLIKIKTDRKKMRLAFLSIALAIVHTTDFNNLTFSGKLVVGKLATKHVSRAFQKTYRF